MDSSYLDLRWFGFHHLSQILPVDPTKNGSWKPVSKKRGKPDSECQVTCRLGDISPKKTFFWFWDCKWGNVSFIFLWASECSNRWVELGKTNFAKMCTKWCRVDSPWSTSLIWSGFCSAFHMESPFFFVTNSCRFSRWFKQMAMVINPTIGIYMNLYTLLNMLDKTGSDLRALFGVVFQNLFPPLHPFASNCVELDSFGFICSRKKLLNNEKKLSESWIIHNMMTWTEGFASSQMFFLYQLFRWSSVCSKFWMESWEHLTSMGINWEVSVAEVGLWLRTSNY